MIWYIWYFSPKCPKRMQQNIRKIHTTDGCHMQTSSHDTIFGFWGIGTNDQVECLEMDLYYEKKSGKNWKFLSFVKDFFPTKNYLKAYVIADGQKGF